LVYALNRAGQFVTRAKVSRVITALSFNKVSQVSLIVPKQFADEVRFFALKKPRLLLRDAQLQPGRTQVGQAALAGGRTTPDAKTADIIICRCEDIKQSEIEAAIDNGFHTFDELKKLLRCGMGPCQGKTCQRLILGMLAHKLGGKPSDFLPGTFRSPVKPVKLGTLARVMR